MTKVLLLMGIVFAGTMGLSIGSRSWRRLLFAARCRPNGAPRYASASLERQGR